MHENYFFRVSGRTNYRKPNGDIHLNVRFNDRTDTGQRPDKLCGSRLVNVDKNVVTGGGRMW